MTARLTEPLRRVRAGRMVTLSDMEEPVADARVIYRIRRRSTQRLDDLESRGVPVRSGRLRKRSRRW